MINYIDKLKEKCKLNDEFVNIIYQIFDKLLEFGYITRHQVKKLQKKLYNNLDVVILGKKGSLDYKSGYYDAVKKELYIKDLANLESVYQRIIYVLTTTQITDEKFDVGFSTSCLSKSNYKIIHKNFGINRAIVSNLVCRLLYTIPTTLSIIPTYRTYENDFLGNKIVADNDIYFLEGKLVSELCYALNIDEENLYNSLFENAQRYLNRLLYKSNIEDTEGFLKLFDDISRDYSNYNKLAYLNKSLNDNYIGIRKSILNIEDKKKLQLKHDRIHHAIRNALAPLINIDSNDEFDTNIESHLSEQINNFEENILSGIEKMQDIFVNILIHSQSSYTTISYAIKLKQLEKLLVVTNENLNTAIYETIFLKLLNNQENTLSNLIDKMKYSMANEILSNEKYIKVYKNIMFNELSNIDLSKSSSLLAITLDNSFMQLVEIDSLNFATKNLKDNTHTIHLENLNYLLNNHTSKMKISEIENIFTSIKDKYKNFSTVSINNMYLCNIENLSLIVVIHDNTFSIINIKEDENKLNFEHVKLSESYSIFKTDNANLPVLYKKKESLFQRLFANFIE